MPDLETVSQFIVLSFRPKEELLVLIPFLNLSSIFLFYRRAESSWFYELRIGENMYEVNAISD